MSALAETGYPFSGSVSHLPDLWSVMRTRQRQQGVTAIEYALLVALIALVILGALSATGLDNGRIWSIWTGTFLQAIGAGGG